MKHLTLLFITFIPSLFFGQYCDSFGLSIEDDLEMGCTHNTLTALHDQLDRDYVYTANAEGGFSVLSSADPENLTLLTNLDSDSFEELTVNRVVQRGTYLYLPLGSMFGAHDQPSGLAILNIENPLFPEVMDVWASADNGGAADVAFHGNYAYLSGLSNGIIVLDISDPTNISFVSSYVPDTTWPEGTDVAKINARSIVIDGSTAYLAYDAGGMRILEIGEMGSLIEIGRYSNPALNGAARAYNNLIKRGDLLYVAVDYAGMEVLNVADPSAVTLHGWWNPNGFPLGSPAATSLRWFSSPWHANEIEMIDECATIFISCGRTEIVGLDVSNPTEPVLCGFFGDSTDAISSYGMTVYKDRLYVGQICSPIPIPFPAEWSGIKSLIYNSECPLTIEDQEEVQAILIYPNPAQDVLNIEAQNGLQLRQILIRDLTGKTVKTESVNFNSLDISVLSKGIYIVGVLDEDHYYEQKLIID